MHLLKVIKLKKNKSRENGTLKDGHGHSSSVHVYSSYDNVLVSILQSQRVTKNGQVYPYRPLAFLNCEHHNPCPIISAQIQV